MADVRIIAVSYEGGVSLHHVTHVWTQHGFVSRQRAVDDLRARRCRYYTLTPSGRIDLVPVPGGVGGWLKALLRGRDGHLASATASPAQGADSLLSLPRLPSPTRPRRSRAAQTLAG